MNSFSMSSEIPVSLPEGREYLIRVAPLHALAESLDTVCAGQGRCLVVTDSNVRKPWAETVLDLLTESGWEARLVIVPAGEASKSVSQLEHIYDEALNWEIERHSVVFAVGGGVVGDLAGFAAATLLRGVPFCQIPTSLMAQVDSSIGGKTGINRAEGKNLVGAFHQPILVHTDPQTLRTLPEREWRSGLSEVIKHALVADSAFFSWLESSLDGILEHDGVLIREMVYRAAGIKARIVSIDEREQGIRAILNFGHTFGHAIERACGYGFFTHGEAIALGMRAAMSLSVQLGRNLDGDRIDAVLTRIAPPLLPESISIDDLIHAMDTDKKRRNGKLRFVILEELGSAVLTDEVSDSQLVRAWKEICTPPAQQNKT